MVNKNLIIAVIVSSVFFGGLGYSFGKTRSVGSFSQFGGGFPSGREGMMGQGNNRSGNMRQGGAGGTSGEVLSKDAQTLTVKLRDGGSRIVLWSPTTQVSRMASGTPDDVMVGSQVFVTGKTNSDGSVSADMVQIRPIGPSVASSTLPRF